MKQLQIHKRIFKEENSLSSLTDTSLPEKIKEFILKNPFPKDDDLHKFAEDNKIEPDMLEQYVYAFLTLILVGGASKGKDMEISKENMDIGHKIELEHCKYDSDNKVIKAMQYILVHKITMDHSFEDKDYYSKSINFKDELKREGK